MRQMYSSAVPSHNIHLCESLQALNLERWLPVLDAWLPHFNGWRSVYLQDESIVEDELPAEQVCELLAQYMREKRRPCDAEFAEDLAHLDCLTWRARHDKPGSRWNCLDETFTAFAERGEALVWEFDTEYPSAYIVKHWLLGRLFVTYHEPQPQST